MQTLGQFQVVHRSTRRTRLKAPKDRRSAAYLATVRRRLMACDGIEDVLVKPDTGSVIVRHTPAFAWSSLGPAALRLEDVPVNQPGVHRAPDRAPAETNGARQPIGPLLQDVVSLALEVAVARRPATQIVQDLALNFLCSALREARRA